MAKSDAAQRASSGVVETAKWLATTSGALGAFFAAGLQFTDLGDAQHQLAATSAFLVALSATGLVLASASKVILPAYDSLAEIGKRQLELQEKLARSSEAPTVPRPTSLDRFAEHDPLFRHLQATWSETPAQLLHRLRDAVDETEAQKVRGEIDSMLEACNAYEARQRYRALLRAIAVAAVLLAASIPTFALAISPAHTGGDIPHPLAVEVLFTAPPSALDSDECNVRAPFDGLTVGGDLIAPQVRLPAQNGCRGVVVHLSPGDTYRLLDLE